MHCGYIGTWCPRFLPVLFLCYLDLGAEKDPSPKVSFFRIITAISNNEGTWDTKFTVPWLLRVYTSSQSVQVLSSQGSYMSPTIISTKTVSAAMIIRYAWDKGTDQLLFKMCLYKVQMKIINFSMENKCQAYQYPWPKIYL